MLKRPDQPGEHWWSPHKRDTWVARIADLYVAHKAMSAAEPGSSEHASAVTAFEDALTVIDTVRQQQATGPALHPAAAKVLATLDREWDGLARHRDFPDAALDNNVSERMLRGPVVGRKNCYGSHAEWSAHLAARVWTLTATAERHGLEPLAYLTNCLTTCADAAGAPPESKDLDRFLPWLPGPTDSQDHDPPNGSGTRARSRRDHRTLTNRWRLATVSCLPCQHGPCTGRPAGGEGHPGRNRRKKS
ncbi:MAG: transposase [Actinomycetota bacterium]|nr:transposase [Actinomycetota bacterium]